jgi:hypothetical protein
MLLLGSAADASEPNPLCWKQPRLYTMSGTDAGEAVAALDKSLRIDRTAEPLPKPFVLNADDAYAYHLRQSAIPDLWSGATRAELLVFTEEPTLLRLTFSPIRGVGAVRWVSEKLLYARVWIGRLDVVDVVVDVETGTVRHREPLRDGGILQQQARDSCRVLTDHPGCKPSCPTVTDPAPAPSSQGTPGRPAPDRRR